MGGDPSLREGSTLPTFEPARDDSRGQRSFAPGVSRCAVWGILNVTPDSFSDGGRFDSVDRALAHAGAMIEAGADVIDVGGESSRPPGSTYGAGAVRVPLDEELRRVMPVVEALAGRGVCVSIDTVKSEVARAALAAGARIVNDVSNGADPRLLEAVAEAGGELVLMHSRAGGRVDETTTQYRDVVAEVLGELLAAVDRAACHGVDRARIWIDPGIGFAKTAAQSVALLGDLTPFVASGHRVLVGASRKSFLARTVVLEGVASEGALPPDRRLGGSIAAATVAALAGAAAVRVHDVRDTAQALALVAALQARGRASC
jgi:dihydropteroate synthase